VLALALIAAITVMMFVVSPFAKHYAPANTRGHPSSTLGAGAHNSATGPSRS
jgi:hypothetical protein